MKLQAAVTAARIVARGETSFTRRELYRDETLRQTFGALEGERVPIWGDFNRKRVRWTQRNHECGHYWCSHCARWIDAELGCADEVENTIGPICDDCAAAVFRVLEK